MSINKKKSRKAVSATPFSDRKLSRKQQKEMEAAVKKAKRDDGIPRTAQQSIPFQRMFPDGICRVTDHYYTKTIQFQDINYQLAQQEDKTAIFEEWCSFLNFFDSSIRFELSFMNMATDAEAFEKGIRIPYQSDGFDDVRAEYGMMLRQQLQKGNNGLTKAKYLTFGIEADSMKQAKPRLDHIEVDLMNNFHRLGVSARLLDGKERLQLMHSMFHMCEHEKFLFDWKSLPSTGLSVKDYIAPTSFAFPGSRIFRMGKLYGAMSYLQITASDISDQLLKDFLDMDSSEIVTMHIQSVDQNKAIKQIKHTITELDRSKIGALNASDSSFTAYDDIRSKLIAGGIPAEQIAFIHDANTEVRKKELFAKVRTGQVRVLMGSTFKMGAGMNVQDRLIALHDLDCPWRPGDLEQRSGRIIRQGNMNKQVHIYRYVTEGTFDSYLWQTVENKQKFISQIMTSKSPVRSCEDVDETALSFAEIKALCAGNPAIKEKMDLDIEVARLKVLKADHQSQQFRMEDNLLKYYPEQIRKLQGIIAGLESDIQVAESHPHPESGFAGITLNGKAFSDKEEAGTSLLEASKQATSCEPVQIGSYRGFEIRASLENFGKDRVLTLVGHLSHRVMLGNDPRGNLIRVDNVIKDIPKLLSASQDQLQNIQKQVALAKAEIGKPFPQEAELVQKSQRLAELNAILDMDVRRNDSEHASEDRESAGRPSVLDALHRRVEDMPPHRRTESHGLEERV